VKRIFDVVIAAAGLLTLAPVLALIAFLVWIGDFHSPLFFARRAGGGGEFRMIKFRTMTPGAWKSGVNSTASGDRRITPVGRWLRRMKLDELPQFVNVLVGDMSLVGPRPQAPADAALYTEQERQILTVRPGITDLASIVFADESAILGGSRDPDLLYQQIIRPWKSRLALLYVEHRSNPLDFCILGLTGLALISRRWALAGVGKVLDGWNAQDTLRRMARRAEPLLAYAPPGAREIVPEYPRLLTHGVRTLGGRGTVPVTAGKREIREFRLEDLLGRPQVRLEESGIRKRLAGRVVLVTGAGGSIGSELCRQIARYHPEALIGFDQGETALYHIDQEMRERFPRVPFFPEVGNIQSRRRLDEILHDYRPESVYHAAAYKHVPMMESHLFEAVENNVLGTRNVAQAAGKSGAEDFVLVSSDKAVRPANVMGATKRLAELACLASGSWGGRTRFMAVRFGNVLGSNGSVIPLFRRQIAAGGPVTVTHPEMRRFFMTIPEAAQLVLQAAAMGAGGEIFRLDMGQAMRIVDLARKMVVLSGLTPDEDIRIEFSGIRPGEKLCEELSALEEHTVPTSHAQIRVCTGGGGISRDAMAKCLEDLRRFSEARDAASLVVCLKEMVPDYNPSSFVLRRALREEPKENAHVVVA
jgi:lipopolysaccharide/colanic/teichoic acid biosynthesis glycosyltransferase/nucleoside-diphosphate-sugar epimerase